MFDFDAGKLVVFGIVALAVIPPKDLPRVLRTVGKYVGQMRRMASDFQGQFMDAIKEAELDTVRKEIEEINKAATVDTTFDPASLMRDSVTKAVEATPVASVEAPSAYETVTADPPAPEAVALEAPSTPEKTPEQTASHPT
jgi:sec-independent protein translocase protein TatB